MIFKETPLSGAFEIEIEAHGDERGFFARSFCCDEFEARGLSGSFLQCNISFNAKRGLLRGMHFQKDPHPEIKLVRCTQGRVFDVIIDLRSDSPTFKRWHSVELSSEKRNALYVPAGFAHGFQTLTETAEVFYQMSERYHAELASGVRWNDTAFNIKWPLPPVLMSEKDASWPAF